MSAMFFLFILPKFDKKLQVKMLQSRRLCTLGLRFFYSRVFYLWGLGLGRRDVHRSVVLVTVLVEFPAGEGLNLGLGLGLDCPLD